MVREGKKLRINIDLDPEIYYSLLAYCKSQSRERGKFIDPSLLFEGFASSLINKLGGDDDGNKRDRTVAIYPEYSKWGNGLEKKIRIIFDKAERRAMAKIGIDVSRF